MIIPYIILITVSAINYQLRIEKAQLMEQFDEKYLVLNTGKYHYMWLGKYTENVEFSFDG